MNTNMLLVPIELGGNEIDSLYYEVLPGGNLNFKEDVSLLSA